MNSIILRRVLAQRSPAMASGMIVGTRAAITMASRVDKIDSGPIYRHFESTTITDQRRFEDEPEPTEDD